VLKLLSPWASNIDTSDGLQYNSTIQLMGFKHLLSERTVRKITAGDDHALAHKEIPMEFTRIPNHNKTA